MDCMHLLSHVPECVSNFGPMYIYQELSAPSTSAATDPSESHSGSSFSVASERSNRVYSLTQPILKLLGPRIHDDAGKQTLMGHGRSITLDASSVQLLQEAYAQLYLAHNPVHSDNHAIVMESIRAFWNEDALCAVCYAGLATDDGELFVQGQLFSHEFANTRMDAFVKAVSGRHDRNTPLNFHPPLRHYRVEYLLSHTLRETTTYWAYCSIPEIDAIYGNFEIGYQPCPFTRTVCFKTVETERKIFIPAATILSTVGVLRVGEVAMCSTNTTQHTEETRLCRDLLGGEAE
ncbi:uncharacterized protein BJ171DRAFT_34992 [Polychytrium aggregatum]|uniref:uncharacterized protein n=1 Tax=Polychytrium aggregatum TaxID=110093 RepID=UPI0022FEEC0D|nr:uncharacterized protein BJ171DRAFT_34992 [Polychytrium aggregatum]KAI9192915.1 hypothetical protein BJ171DRAFT_34992 [Polychytrium aggregatum]